MEMKFLARMKLFIFVFLIFVIFCFHIVLMNVFTGLAVGNVATVMRIVSSTSAPVDLRLRPSQDVNVLAVLDFQISCFRPEATAFNQFAHHEDHRQKTKTSATF